MKVSSSKPIMGHSKDRKKEKKWSKEVKGGKLTQSMAYKEALRKKKKATKDVGTHTSHSREKMNLKRKKCEMRE